MDQKFISDGFKRKPVLPNEFRIFWGGLIICPVLWALFGLMALFTLKVKIGIHRLNSFDPICI